MMDRWKSSLPAVWKPVRWLLLSCLLLLLTALFILADLEKGQELIWFNEWRGSWTDSLFKLVTRFGEAYSYIALTLLIFFLRRRDAWWIPLTGIVVTLVSFIMKSFFRSPRPGAFAAEPWFAEELVLVEGVRPLTGMTSLPSGHTMAAFALAFMIIYLIPLRRIAWLPVLVLALLVGISRMYLVLHFLQDVVLGMTIGLVIAFVLAMLHQRFQVSAPVSGSSAGTDS